MSHSQREYINEAQKHYFASGVPKTEVYQPIIPDKRLILDTDIDESPMPFGKRQKTRFDAKNPDDAHPKENGEYIPVLRYLNEKNRQRGKNTGNSN